MMENWGLPWLAYLRDINLPSIALRIVLSMLLGGFLGFERGRKHRPAGFRTYMLVSLGAALVMMTNQYVFRAFNTSDPVRMGAQVISGIGFLGAGTIIVTGRNQIKGITTAAGLWTAACSGLAVGIGFYEAAILGFLAIYFTMVLMQRLDSYIHSRSRVVEIYVEYGGDAPFSAFLEYAREAGLEITDIQLNRGELNKNTALCAIVMVKSRIKRSHGETLHMLSQASGILHIEEIVS